MIPFRGPELPASARDLEAAVKAELERWFVVLPDRPVATVEDESFPRVRGLHVDLRDARLLGDPAAAVPRDVRGTGALVEAGRLRVDAAPIVVTGHRVAFRFDARDATLEAAVAADGRALLRPVGGTGDVFGSIDRSDLEGLVRNVVGPQARAKGVAVESVSIDLAPRGERGMQLSSRVRVRKIFTAEIVVDAAVVVDDALDLVVHEVRARGEGMIGALLGGTLDQMAGRISGRRIPLTALPIGSLRLDSVRLEVNEGIAVFATFAS